MIEKNRFYIYKLVLFGLLLSWLIKYPAFFYQYLTSTITDYPLSFNFFPEFFKSSYSAAFFYYLPVITISVFFLKIIQIKKIYLQAGAGIFCLSSVIILCHQATYNDATFNVSFWVSCWLLWYSTNIDSKPAELEKHLIILAKLIVTLIFLGGFIGKLTNEWWSGEALFGIYQNFFNHYPFTYIKEEYSLDDQMKIMSVLAKVIIVFELIITLGIFIKDRLYFTIIPLLIFGIVIFRGWQILSVTGSMICLLIACRASLKHNLLQKNL